LNRFASLILALPLAFVAMAPAQLLPPSNSPASQPTTAPTSQPADVAAIKETLSKYNAAVDAGDVPVLSGFITTSSPTQQKALALMGRLTTSGRSVYNASVEKFTEAGLAKENVEKAAFPGGFPPLPAEQLDVRPDGDKASLVNRLAAEAPPLSMKKVDGQWKIDGDSLLPNVTEKQLTEQTSIIDAAIGAIDQTANDVKLGHITGADEVIVLMNHRVQKAVRAAQMKLMPMEEMPPTPTTGPAAGAAGPDMAPGSK
jgi:hypothetical protein